MTNTQILDSKEKEFVVEKLTKKALLKFCDEQIAMTKLPLEFPGGGEEAKMKMEEEWKILNEEMKLKGFKKNKRHQKRRMLKVKYGLAFSHRVNYNNARIVFIKVLKNHFGLN